MAMERTYKKVINFAPSTVGASTQHYLLAVGVDSLPLGQTGPTDAGVPTGAKIRTIVVQFPIGNILASSLVIHVALQYILSGQTAIAPNVVGGNPQRNQVLHQFVRSVGQFQNANISYTLKIPKRFQRMKESMQWMFSVTSSASAVQTAQIIYTIRE